MPVRNRIRATYHIFKKKNILGQNVRYFRRLQNPHLSQERLAWLVYRRSRSHISAIENGSELPSLYLLFDIAAALKIPPFAFLVEGSENIFLLYACLRPRDKVELQRYAQRLLSLSDPFTLLEMKRKDL